MTVLVFFFHLCLLSLFVLSSKAIMMKVQRLLPSARRHAQQGEVTMESVLF